MLKSKLSEIDNKRAASQLLPKGSAPYTCSTFFKVRQPGGKPVAKSWDHRFSEDSQQQHTSSLKAAARAAHPEMISLGTARPWAEYFPWKALEMLCPGPEGLGSTVSMDCVKEEDEYDLDIVMNYGYAGGDWECAITCGTTSAMEIAFRLFCNPGDTILMESHTYTGTLSAALAQGLKIQGVAMDELGLVPEDLNHKLENWDSLKGPKPSVLYMIPCGQNPTGSTQSLERRQAIYRVAEAHDLYIFEDDPYYLIQLGEDSSEDSDKGLDADDYLRSLPASYLSLDVSGRVLRMDTTSKVLAPGLRCGWVTASSQVINKFIAYSEVSVASPSGPSQAMIYKLLDQTWGHEGFIRWAMMLSVQYRRRRDILFTACKAHLPSGICSWRVPDVGMFLWINLNLSYPSLAMNDKDSEWEAYRYTEDTIFSKAQENGVVVSKGSWFMTNVTEMRGVSFRLTFAAAQEEGIARAVERFGRAIRSYLEDAAGTGDICGSYQKRNLWHPERPYLTLGRNPHLAAGTPLKDINGKSLRAGLLICWDLTFPEGFRALVQDGADLIIIPAYWSTAGGEDIRQLNGDAEIVFLDSVLTARAFENNAVVVFCNAGGLSRVTLPILGSLGSIPPFEDNVEVFEVDLDVLRVAEERYKIRKDMQSLEWQYK
ncbi:hypothetical protein BFJ65_g15464 [Fusarium oxysporum f. sp. cepae]|uniref:CN hydrolase domain-containing protein n=1 Tax=Fusarium oxysporum f. sp. cepae TaxID=396571 RepID=A0A3L6N0Z6_FUSOX|nr:hypothetical protein BFJ65_g15464 [Fusarium oxysporum f. sp. cepae]